MKLRSWPSGYQTHDASGIVARANPSPGRRQSGRTDPDRIRVKQLLATYASRPSAKRSRRQSRRRPSPRRQIGYPVVLKLFSETITHKTDVGGVQLDLAKDPMPCDRRSCHPDAVAAKAGAQHFLGVTVQPMVKLDGYELIVGSSIDPQFGPVLLFGSGGQLVEVYKDHALALPPLNSTLARRMMEQCKIYQAMQGFRGRAPVDLTALEALLVTFSNLVTEQPVDQGNRYQSAAGLLRASAGAGCPGSWFTALT